MLDAAENDIHKNRAKLPALAKMAMLEEVCRSLNKLVV
jgi:hypothetical protein